MNIKVLNIMSILVITLFSGTFLYLLNGDFQKTRQYLESNQQPIETFDEVPKTSDLELQINQLKKIGVESKIPEKMKKQIIFLLNGLKTKDKEKTEKIKRQLIEKGSETSDTRKFIIYQLLENLDYQEYALIKSKPEKLLHWQASIDILGDLEAEESINYLIYCLDFGTQRSNSMDEFRAYIAILKLKEKEIPSLIIALRNGRPQVRLISAKALGDIGGQKSKQALESALVTEKDEWIHGRIRDSLIYLRKKCEQPNSFQECSDQDWNY